MAPFPPDRVHSSFTMIPHRPPSEDNPAIYKCDYQGCGKGFTRKDHLLRHAANHSDTTFHCSKCNRGFKRLDLLQRHEGRNICADGVKGEDDTPTPSTMATQSESVDRRTPTRIESTSKRQKTAHASSSKLLVHPKVEHASPHVSTHPMSAPPTYGAGPDIEVAPQHIWDINLFQPAAWDALPAMEMAAPFNEPAYDMNFASWNLSTPNRMQESAERGLPETMASAGLVFRLNQEYPEFDVDLPYLAETLDSYWTNVAASFPFVHRGTFVVNDAPSKLVIMMVITGSAHLSTPRVNYHKMVQKIRGALTQGCGLDMPITTLQAYALCHVYDTWYGTSESLFIAQCMWPVMVAHSRRKGIGVIDPPDREGIQEEEAWSAWAKDEERRRAAFCVLLLDTQASAFWNQSPSRQLSIFAHNIALPCRKSQWDALTAVDWLRVREPPPLPLTTSGSRKRSPLLLPGLHPIYDLTNVSEGYSSNLLYAIAAEEQLKFGLDLENKFGAEMILIGLTAAAWDFRTRGGMGIKLSGVKDWRLLVLNGVINMRAAWEANVHGLAPAIEIRDMRDTFAISIISILSDIPMLQVAAGAKMISGSTIGTKQYQDARQRLKIWVEGDYAWTCLWQSARYLRQALFADWGIYTPWAVYLTTLVHWGFAHCLNTKEDIHPPSDQPHQNAQHLLDFILGSAKRPHKMHNSVGDLIHCATEKLGEVANRSGVLEEGGISVERESAEILGRLLLRGGSRSESPATSSGGDVLEGRH